MTDQTTPALGQLEQPEQVSVPDFTAPGRTRTVTLLPRTSAAPVKPYWERIDLYYATELWERTSAGSIDWRIHAKPVHKNVLLGTGTTRSVTVWEPDFTDAHASYLATSPTVRAVLAFLAAYHHATASQLAALTGAKVSTTQEALRKAFQAGLVKRGRFVTGAEMYATPYLYTLHDSAALKGWLRSLTDAHKLGVTCGQRVGAGPAHAKHNMLVGELALRAAEVHPGLQAVFGELLGSPELLLPVPPQQSTTARGDAVLVRGDGLRVVLEFVQASKAREMAEKMARWGRLLKGADWNSNGLVVVFVSGNRSGNQGALKQLMREHAAALSPEGLRDDSGPATSAEVARARAQIHLASWDDWFPAPWRVSDDFAALRTAFTPDGQSWRRVDLAHAGQGGMPFAPADPDRWLAPGRHRGQVLSVPRWAGGPVTSALTLPGDGAPDDAITGDGRRS